MALDRRGAARGADLVRRLNTGGQTVIHTVRLKDHSGEDVLKQVAEENGGNYKFVTAEDLATVANK